MLATTLLTPACKSDPPKPSAEDPIVIGVSLGLTKDLASFCGPLRDSVRAAEGEINAGGGVLGRQVKFDVVDDRSDEAEFVAGVANDFAARGVAAVLGPVGSGQVKATQSIFAEKQIIQISPSATSTELTNIQPSSDRYLFRTTPADDFQGAAVILFATKTPRGLGDAGAGGDPDAGVSGGTCNKLAIAYLDNPYGTSMAKVISDNFPKRGAGKQVVSQQKIPLETKSSYADVVKGIIGSAPECLALIVYDKAAAQFVRDFKADPGYADLEKNGFFFIGTDGVYTQGFLDGSQSDAADPTGPSTAEGVFGTNPDTQPGTVEYNRYRTIYSSYFPLKSTDDAPAFTANMFDAAVLAAFAVQKAGNTTDRVAIRDALKAVSAPPGQSIGPDEITQGLIDLRNGDDIDYKGASGNVDLQANGNTTSGFIVWQAVRDAVSKKVVYKTVARFTTEELVGQIQ
jgi:ABC-type branched-subunit amino acid transport system substrate-binding protein